VIDAAESLEVLAVAPNPLKCSLLEQTSKIGCSVPSFPEETVGDGDCSAASGVSDILFHLLAAFPSILSGGHTEEGYCDSIDGRLDCG
jgi:hypothetical protein